MKEGSAGHEPCRPPRSIALNSSQIDMRILSVQGRGEG